MNTTHKARGVMWTMAPNAGAATVHHRRVIGAAGPMSRRRTATTIPDAVPPPTTAAPIGQADHPRCVVATKTNADLLPGAGDPVGRKDHRGCVVATKTNADLLQVAGDPVDRKDHPGCVVVISHVAVPRHVVDRRPEVDHLGLAQTSDFVADHRGCAVTIRPAVHGEHTDLRLETVGLPGRATAAIHVVAPAR